MIDDPELEAAEDASDESLDRASAFANELFESATCMALYMNDTAGVPADATVFDLVTALTLWLVENGRDGKTLLDSVRREITENAGPGPADAIH